MPYSTTSAYAFFDQVISSESKRTLLQATVNTIQAGDPWKREAMGLDLSNVPAPTGLLPDAGQNFVGTQRESVHVLSGPGQEV